MSYNHTAISVVDREKTQAFYEQLGFTKFREWKKPAENLEAVVMRKDNFLLELVYSTKNKVLAPPDPVESRHIGLSISDLQDTLSQLQAQGVRVLKPITKGVTVKEFAFVTDPSGNVVELLVEIE